MTTVRDATIATDAESPASPEQSHIALTLAVFITLVALATMPYARTPGPVIAAFIPIGVTAVILLDLITALLFLLQYHRHGRASTLALGCAYLYTGLVVIPYILTFPGVFSPDGLLGAGSQSAAWLWLFWHGGFPALLLVHAGVLRHELRGDPTTHRPAIGVLPATLATLLLVVALGVLATLGHDWLPAVIQRDNYHPPATPGIGLIVCLLNLIALVALWLITRRRTVTQLWLLIAMLAFLFDTVVSLAAGARYTLGWYVARANSLLCAGAVLGAFIFEFHRLQMRLAAANRRLTELADTDGLTGLGNRRSFDRLLAQEWARAARNDEPLALLLLDIDHFKAYNDGYGHQAGDACLRRIAEAVRDALRRPGDFAARYGGEELAIILPQTNRDSALLVAQHLRNAIEQLGIEHRNAPPGIVTCSIGIGVKNPGSDRDPQALFAEADAAMYKAKDAGRNRVCC
jgi:diguanylate cyclase (GGDEF)-like protein